MHLVGRDPRHKRVHRRGDCSVEGVCRRSVDARVRVVELNRRTPNPGRCSMETNQAKQENRKVSLKTQAKPHREPNGAARRGHVTSPEVSARRQSWPKHGGKATGNCTVIHMGKRQGRQGSHRRLVGARGASGAHKGCLWEALSPERDATWGMVVGLQNGNQLRNKERLARSKQTTDCTRVLGTVNGSGYPYAPVHNVRRGTHGCPEPI